MQVAATPPREEEHLLSGVSAPRDLHAAHNKKRLMMIALLQDPRARRPFLVTVFHFDDSPSAQRRNHLPFLVNRFRINLNKNGAVGIPFVFLCSFTFPTFSHDVFPRHDWIDLCRNGFR